MLARTLLRRRGKQAKGITAIWKMVFPAASVYRYVSSTFASTNESEVGGRGGGGLLRDHASRYSAKETEKLL